MKVYPVSGKVLVRAAPADGARVVFYPVAQELKEAGMPAPAATTDENGVYRLRTFDPEDGAPEGEYQVTIVWLEPIPPNVDRETYEPKDRLKGRYANPQSSKLTATVERGGGELPTFELE